MQAIKDKLNDMSSMRKAKAEAKEEERGEKELAKARLEVAHEVRLAREAEAAMDLHVKRAADKATHREAKQPDSTTDQLYGGPGSEDPYSCNPSDLGRSTDQPYGGPGTQEPCGGNASNVGPTTTTGMGYSTNTTGVPPNNKYL